MEWMSRVSNKTKPKKNNVGTSRTPTTATTPTQQASMWNWRYKDFMTTHVKRLSKKHANAVLLLLFVALAFIAIFGSTLFACINVITIIMGVAATRYLRSADPQTESDTLQLQPTSISTASADAITTEAPPENTTISASHVTAPNEETTSPRLQTTRIREKKMSRSKSSNHVPPTTTRNPEKLKKDNKDEEKKTASYRPRVKSLPHLPTSEQLSSDRPKYVTSNGCEVQENTFATSAVPFVRAETESKLMEHEKESRPEVQANSQGNFIQIPVKEVLLPNLDTMQDRSDYREVPIQIVRKNLNESNLFPSFRNEDGIPPVGVTNSTPKFGTSHPGTTYRQGSAPSKAKKPNMADPSQKEQPQEGISALKHAYSGNGSS